MDKCGAQGCVGELKKCAWPGCDHVHPNMCSTDKTVHYCFEHHLEPEAFEAVPFREWSRHQLQHVAGLIGRDLTIRIVRRRKNGSGPSACESGVCCYCHKSHSNESCCSCANV